MTNFQRLKELTEELQESANYLVDIFQKVKSTGESEDFYEVVRPYANKVAEWNAEWKDLAEEWVKTEKPLYLHPSQISTASDHLEVISIQAFFKETSKKRFLDSAKSVQFILQTVLDRL
ncbi:MULTISPECIES: YppE family protein [Bacillaceae]|uniref:YppE family protein n=1 Tax=Bacillaceae TaxID=186817 RepID=UPI001E33384C|nr:MULTISPECIES: YppE family protein [Bacillaceae]MCE4047251.1 YppE family protein [Bacillus sp. Au-Bac7]MDL0435788.1 YppE family protein [Niallia sp. SS-2023]UPO86384.1 YppE family protein [Niallia sp. Man26]